MGASRPLLIRCSGSRPLCARLHAIHRGPCPPSSRPVPTRRRREPLGTKAATMRRFLPLTSTVPSPPPVPAFRRTVGATGCGGLTRVGGPDGQRGGRGLPWGPGGGWRGVIPRLTANLGGEALFPGVLLTAVRTRDFRMALTLVVGAKGGRRTACGALAGERRAR